ncbi:MAG: hypothetical protein VR70_08175 [Rhodospirillaceae bacterium BRH_c57]|nr:MAG: hypothetical protein VR70_08175 [Rhodospirillaceae bacterium BRH_c57]
MNQLTPLTLATLCHDLRQPLMAARLFLSLLERRVGGGEELVMLQRAADSLGAMERIVAAGTAGSPRLVPVPLGSLIADVVAGLGPLAQATAVTVAAMPSQLVGVSHPVLLSRMLRNLVVNALTHSSGSRVVVGCRRRGDKIALQVWDDGIGMAAGQWRGGGTVAGTDGGDRVGLGLPSVSLLAEQLFHEVDVRSWDGRGTRFSILMDRVPMDRA